MCNVDKTAFQATATITATSGNVITVTGIASSATNYFAGGYVELDAGNGLKDRRFITSSTNTTLTLNTAFGAALQLGITTILVYPGCDHTLSTCKNKFSNTLNYGGWPFIPSKNPFGGDPVY